MEHNNTNGHIPFVNDFDRPMISPAYQPSDENPINALLCETNVLDCSICHEALSLPVFQCINGHIACDKCHTNVEEKCTMCSMPIRYRCRAIEKVLESIIIACDYAEYGCNKMVRYNEKSAHQKTCMFEPCLCPQEGCDFLSSPSDLYLHYRMSHLRFSCQFHYGVIVKPSIRHDEDMLVLRALSDGKLFVIRNKVQPSLGHLITLCHIGPKMLSPQFRFEMMVKSPQGIRGTMMIQSQVKNIQDRTASPSSSFLLVPFEFQERCGSITMAIRISVIGDAQPAGPGHNA